MYTKKKIVRALMAVIESELGWIDPWDMKVKDALEMLVDEGLAKYSKKRQKYKILLKNIKD